LCLPMAQVMACPLVGKVDLYGEISN